MSAESINYKYVAFAGVILILLGLIAYGFNIQRASNVFIPDSEIDRCNCRVRTSKGVVALDPNVFQIHMRRTRDNLNTLNKDICSDNSTIKKNLAKAKADLSSYAALNLYPIKGGTRPGIKTYMQNDDITYERVPRESVLKTLYENPRINLATADVHYEIDELVSDIDTIIELSRGNDKKNGELDLTAVNALTESMYADRASNSSVAELNSVLGIIDKKYNDLFDISSVNNITDKKEKFITEDLFSKQNYEFWKWYDVAGTNSNWPVGNSPPDTTECDEIIYSKHNASVIKASSSARTLDGSQIDPNYDVSNSIAQTKESFNLPKDKSHNVFKSSSSVSGINANPFVSQGVEREFGSTPLYRMKSKKINDRNPRLNSGSMFNNQISSTRSSLFD
jgi:hypothetical protein